MFFPNRIRQARIRRGLTQIELGNRAGVTYGTMSRLECGHIQASKELRRKLCKVLGVTSAWLFPAAKKSKKAGDSNENIIREPRR
jgi:transcriptional regulator with XRE-family HTH domain